jgi:hypothetical protein
MTYKTVDLRDQIPGDPVANQGAKEKTKGVVVHYNGADNGFAGVADGELSVQQRYANDANDHIQRDWGDGATVNGVQYHYGCWEDTIYILRNPDAKLWHCGDGIEEDSFNYSATAVQVPISTREQVTVRTVQTLREFCDDELERQGLGAPEVRGHQEISSTTCPHSLMDDFVRPYRTDGEFGPHEPPIKPVKYNLCASDVPDAEVAKVAEERLKTIGITEVQVVIEPDQIRYVSDVAYSNFPVGAIVAIHVGSPTLKHVTLEVRDSFGLDWDTSDNWSCAGSDLNHTKKLVGDALKEIWTREYMRLHDLLVAPFLEAVN